MLIGMQDEDNAVAPSGAVNAGMLGGMLSVALRRAQAAVNDDLVARFTATGVRPGHFGILEVLKHNPGLRQGHLSDALGVKRTNLVPLLDMLEARGLIERQAVAGDRRVTALFLTDGGAALLAQLQTMARAHEALLAARLGPDGRAQLLDLLARLTTPVAGG